MTDDRRYGLIGNTAIKSPCRAATTAAVTLSGEQTVDGTACVTNDRVLVKNQASAIDNGIYVVDTGAWIRAADFDGTYDAVQGTLVLVATGTINANIAFELTTANPVIGTSSLTFIASLVFGSFPVSIATGGTGASTAAAARAALGLAIGSDVQAYDAATVKANATKTLTAGYSCTPYNAGIKSAGTFTPDEANGGQQYCINGGAFTLAPPANKTTIVLEITNNASAGAITTAGFTKVSGAFTTTNGHKFLCNVTTSQTYSLLQITALQ